MKTMRRYIINSGCLPAIVMLFSQARVPYSPDHETFIGSTPCDPAVRLLLSIPADLDCELIKWNLALVLNPENRASSTFRLKYTYGMSRAGTEGLVNNGTSAELTGNWIVQKNTGKLPGQSLLLLKPVPARVPLTFLKLDNNLLHLTDNADNLMIGNAGWSYTLNRLK